MLYKCTQCDGLVSVTEHEHPNDGICYTARISIHRWERTSVEAVLVEIVRRMEELETAIERSVLE